MYVITADQIDSRNRPDIVGVTRAGLDSEYRPRLVLPVDQMAGDEIQVLTADAGAALDIALKLTRSAQWSVGLGVGPVRHPLPDAVREANGEAFYAARDAVIRAKKQASRFALESGDIGGLSQSRELTAGQVESLLNLLLLMRDRRSPAGWELYDLITSGLTQNEAARRLGITPPSASSRARAAGIRAESESVPSLTRLLENLDRTSSARTGQTP